jgi:hypothetical protein
VTTLLNQTITTAISAVPGSVWQFRPAQFGSTPRHLSIQAQFVYGGSGGTSATAFLQTSFDGGTTWCDIACFAFTTSSATKICNLSSLTAVATQATPTNGSLANNSCVDGFLGPVLRVLVTTVGTYAGGTTLTINADSNDRMILQGSE